MIAATTFFVTEVITHTDAVRTDDAVYYTIACDSWGDVPAAHIIPDVVPKFIKSMSRSVPCNLSYKTAEMYPGPLLKRHQ